MKTTLLLHIITTFLFSGISLAAESPRTITPDTIFPDGKPANDYISLILDELAKPDGLGQPLTEAEFRAFLDQADPTVYEDHLLRYATPKSRTIQEKEHSDYTDIFMQEKRLEAGVRFHHTHRELLERAQEQYGVHRKDIVAILMWESGLGEFTGDSRVFNIFMGQILFLEDARAEAVQQLTVQGNPDDAELAYTQSEEKRFHTIRRRAARNIAALFRVSRERGIDPFEQRGSWGGAIGYVQFLPASLVYAADGDGDGNIDLHDWPDAVSSVASYLHENGYGMDGEKRRRGIFTYNRSQNYVKGVIRYADEVWSRYQPLETNDPD